MPKILMINGYQISIWSNENGEPMHVHISKKKPSANSFKLWLLSNGTFVKANSSDTRISDSELKKIMLKLAPQFELVKNYWIAYHGYEKYIK